jgi:hypothetical protein
MRPSGRNKITMENTADLYYEKLGSTDKPGGVLAKFYEEIFSRPYSVQDIILFNKLVRVYGKYIPYFAILDLFSYEKAEIGDNMFGLLSYYCKKRLEQKTEVAVLNDAYKNLDTVADKVLERIEQLKDKPFKAKRME